MYNQLLYFIIALLIFTVQQPGRKAFLPPFATVVLGFLVFCAYVAACHFTFRPLRRALTFEGEDPSLARRFHSVQGRLSILGLVSLGCLSFVLNIKFYLQLLPGFQWSLTLPGAAGLLLYLVHLSVIWAYGHPVYQRIQGSSMGLAAYLKGNASFQMAILAPWLIISLMSDLLDLVKKPVFLHSDAGQTILFALMLGCFICFGPALVVKLWGCASLQPGPVRMAMESFCQRHGFRVGDFKVWPLLSGEMLTAGIMGILPRLRYILITRGLMSLLDTEEIEAVVAHEMGHVRRYHLPFYLVFFLSFSFLAFSYNDLVVLSLLQNETLLATAFRTDSTSMTLFSVAYTLPMFVLLIVYFRFIFGFFMRNSERQADLYALKTVGHPYTLISSLEKIAYASGRIHDVPSWHHYSIRERVQFLWRSHQDPSLPVRHDRKLYGAAALFLVAVAFLSWAGPVLQRTETVRQWRFKVELRLVESSLQAEPENAQLQAAYGGLLLEMERYGESETHLLRALELEPDDPTILNNLAWLYATAPPPVANATAALELAKEALQLKPEPFIWDTLAQAYFANGLYEESLEAIKHALITGTDNRDHYLKQKQKFEEALKRNRMGS